MFYLDPPMNTQNDRVWGSGRKRDIASERLLHQRAKFSRRVMVSAGVCFNCKGRLHFVPEKLRYRPTTTSTIFFPNCWKIASKKLAMCSDFSRMGRQHTLQNRLMISCK